jgi:phospholipase/carboxylesterase
MPASIEHVAWSKPIHERSGSRLVVALHGRGSDESSMTGLSAYLPSDVTVAAPRGPVHVGGGFTWFANRGIGRPIEESIKDTGAALFAWLDDVSADHRDVIVLGFSGGTAMAGGLILAEPQRFSGAVLLSGTLPWDAGYELTPDRLKALPVFWSIDPADDMIPRELAAHSEEWLRADSGADLKERLYPDLGHAISLDELADVSAFITGVGQAR